jgi:hypothetical protein
MPVQGFGQGPKYLQSNAYISYLETLKHGNLLVRLSDRASFRKKSLQYGEVETLKKFDASLQTEYNEIFNAFLANYKIGKVYFFLHSETDLLKAGKFSEMRFFDIHGQNVSHDEINTQKFLIAEFAKMEQKTRGPLFETKKVEEKESGKTTFSALVVREKDLTIIDKSFYLFVRTIFRSKSRVVKKLNKRLTRNLSYMEPANN